MLSFLPFAIWYFRFRFSVLSGGGCVLLSLLEAFITRRPPRGTPCLMRDHASLALPRRDHYIVSDIPTQIDIALLTHVTQSYYNL